MTQEEQVKKNLEMVLNALAERRVFEGQPSLFSEAYREELARNVLYGKGQLDAEMFQVLLASRIQEELLLDIQRSITGTQVAENEGQLLDFYLHREVYEETVNRLVEEVNGGMLSYDYASHVLAAYDAHLRNGLLPDGHILGVEEEVWVSLCIGIHDARSLMDTRRFQNAREAIRRSIVR